MASNRFAGASWSFLWTVVSQCVTLGTISTYCRQAEVRLSMAKLKSPLVAN